MNHYSFMMIAVIVGGLLIFQGIINSRLAQALDHPLQASFISFSVAIIILLIVMTVRGIALPSASLLKPIPTYLFIGGVLGVIYVTTVLILLPKIGATNVVFALLIGQSIVSVTVDHFGFGGLPKNAFGWSRALGCILLFSGFYLVQLKLE